MFVPPVPSITVKEITKDMVILDVREDDEWQAGHAPGALHVPMMEIPARIEEVPSEDAVAVICRSGSRSAQVVGYLVNSGRTNAYNLDGGMRAWVAGGRTVEREDGEPGIVM